MAISAADVKNLREMTGVGMMDCKKALTECDGDIDKAIEYLREKGLAASAKKAGRIAAEGMAYATVIDGVGVVVEVNCDRLRRQEREVPELRQGRRRCRRQGRPQGSRGSDGGSLRQWPYR